MFIAAIFTIAKTWRKLTCPSTGEWIKNTHTHTHTHTHNGIILSFIAERVK